MPPLWVGTVALSCLVSFAPGDEGEERKLADCPAAVRKTFQVEAKGVKIETVVREKDGDDETIYWADVSVDGRTYALGVLEDGTLTEMNLALDDDDLDFDRCPDDVQATFRREAFDVKIDTVGKDMRYGVTVYEAVVAHKGKSYEVVVAKDGTLVEKVLIIEDDEVELATCPAPVKAAFHEHARGGTIHQITRSTGIVRPTYEAEVEIDRKVYLVEVADSGRLIAKSLEAGEEP